MTFFASLPHRIEGLLPDEISVRDFGRTLSDFPELRNSLGGPSPVRVGPHSQGSLEVRHLEKLLRLFPNIDVAPTVSTRSGKWIHCAMAVQAAGLLKHRRQVLERFSGFGFLSHGEWTGIFRPLNE